MGWEGHLPPPALDVRLEDGRTFRFSRPFLIGREPACDVCVDDGRVSRRHVLVAVENGRWQIHDQQSGNGLIVDGRRVQSAAVGRGLSIRLGYDGPLVRLEPVIQQAARPPEAPYVPNPDAPIGSRTMFFQRTIRKQRRTYLSIVAVLALVAVAAGTYAWFAHQRVLKLEAVAQEVFYRMKAAEVRLFDELRTTGRTLSDEERTRYAAKVRELEREYDNYLDEQLEFYNPGMPEQDRLILKVTRRLGECELAAPPGYIKEVKRFIGWWRSSPRWVRGVTLARNRGYTSKIVEELDRQDLPREFFYLALQESDFNDAAVGPKTNWGFAKGMWQFIPDTARTYGLKTGPLSHTNRKDPDDERHDWEKATKAAAAYIKAIYATDAKASGLLVMASYNWGERRVADRISKMPKDPRQRNLWQLLARYRIPDQTYNYVFSIVAAAVIGENPRLFDIQMDNPLAPGHRARAN